VTVRVVVADDQAAVRTGLAMILESAPDIEVVGEVGDGLSAVRAATELGARPGAHGRPDAGRRRHRGHPASRRRRVCEVLVLTTFDIDEYVDAAWPRARRGSC
jgi:DNA-binding NarL/FixJ family response regulator